MTELLATTKNFYLYQRERFPVIILGLSFLPAILSSGAVVTGHVQLEFVVVSLIVSIAYLLHVRIIDEFRDFEHDIEHHKERPVSMGRITLNELRTIDWIAVVTLILLAIYIGLGALLMVFAMLFYSYIARNEFFLGLQFRQHFYIYNAVNLIQMLLLQILVYTIASESFSFNLLILVHFLFTSTGTVIFEFLRKVKIPGQDGTGQDTYTWFLGFNNALLIYVTLVIVNVFLFVKAMFLIQSTGMYWPTIASLLIIGVFSTLSLHKLRQKEKTSQLMQLLFMVMYAGFNILLFLVI